MGVLCKKAKGVTHRFIKVGRGWTFNLGGKMVTKFFSVEGKAYTAIVKDTGPVNVSVSEYLRWLWGEPFYKIIPDAQKRSVETDVVGITVAIEPIEEETLGLPTISADDIHDQDDAAMLRRFTESTSSGKVTSTFRPFLMGIAIGALAMFFLITKGFV